MKHTNFEAVKTQEVINYLRDTMKSEKMATILSLCDKYNTTPSIVRAAVSNLYNNKFPVTIRDDKVVYTATPEVPYKVVSNHRVNCHIGIMGDLHCGSKVCQEESIKSFVHECHEQGITEIYIAGDITDGVGVYEGQMYEQKYVSVADQVNLLCDTLPTYSNLKYYFILGNHDDRAFRKVGVSVGQLITLQRNDMIYVGDDWGVVRIGHNTDIALHHPSGGGGKVLSSRVQRTVCDVLRLVRVVRLIYITSRILCMCTSTNHSGEDGAT